MDLTESSFVSKKARRDRLLVVKFGGSVLDSGLAIRRAAESVERVVDGGGHVVIVVSAIKGFTDQIISLAEEISDDTPPDVIDYIIGLGEEQSVRLMTSALISQGVDAVEVISDTPSWPIVTDENYGNAEPIMKECRRAVELGLMPLIERGKTLVVCGFIGRSQNGKITTLGRGGSDTTAVILANCLDADELVLVKDVEGIYSTDPRKIDDVKLLESVTAWEAKLLASTGAKVIHDKIFRYKPEGLNIRVVSSNNSLDEGGTVVGGTVPELKVEVHGRPVMKITVLGNLLSDPETLTQISQELKERVEIQFLKALDNVTVLCVNEHYKTFLERLNSLIGIRDQVKAFSVEEGLAYIKTWGYYLDDVTRSIIEIHDALSANDIEVRELVTGQSFIGVLVDWDRREICSSLLKESLRRI